MKRILFLGPIGPGQTSRMRMRALVRNGYTTAGVDTVEPWHRASWIKRQVGRRLRRGAIVAEINERVRSAARDFRPDIVWAEKQEYLEADTIESLRAGGARLVHYTPDPYFTLAWKRTSLMDAAIRAFDVLVYCKAYEREDYERLGKPLVYMPLGYCDEVHRPLPSSDPRWACSVGFLGGWEPRREQLLHAVAENDPELKIWGGYWEFLRDGQWSPRRQIILRQLAGGDRFRFHRDELLASALQGGEVYGDEYARALTGARIGLGLLRKVCRDAHTTRTFEIPACGSLLLADRTGEHQELFAEGKEADFFDSTEELLDKLRYYRTNERARSRVAKAGQDRCRTANYAYVHRVRAALASIERS